MATIVLPITKTPEVPPASAPAPTSPFPIDYKYSGGKEDMKFADLADRPDLAASQSAISATTVTCLVVNSDQHTASLQGSRVVEALKAQERSSKTAEVTEEPRMDESRDESIRNLDEPTATATSDAPVDENGESLVDWDLFSTKGKFEFTGSFSKKEGSVNAQLCSESTQSKAKSGKKKIRRTASEKRHSGKKGGHRRSRSVSPVPDTTQSSQRLLPVLDLPLDGLKRAFSHGERRAKSPCAGAVTRRGAMGDLTTSVQPPAPTPLQAPPKPSGLKRSISSGSRSRKSQSPPPGLLSSAGPALKRTLSQGTKPGRSRSRVGDHVRGKRKDIPVVLLDDSEEDKPRQRKRDGILSALSDVSKEDTPRQRKSDSMLSALDDESEEEPPRQRKSEGCLTVARRGRGAPIRKQSNGTGERPVSPSSQPEQSLKRRPSPKHSPNSLRIAGRGLSLRNHLQRAESCRGMSIEARRKLAASNRDESSVHSASSRCFSQEDDESPREGLQRQRSGRNFNPHLRPTGMSIQRSQLVQGLGFQDGTLQRASSFRIQRRGLGRDRSPERKLLERKSSDRSASSLRSTSRRVLDASDKSEYRIKRQTSERSVASMSSSLGRDSVQLPEDNEREEVKNEKQTPSLNGNKKQDQPSPEMVAVPVSALASITALTQMVTDLQREVSGLRKEVKELKSTVAVSSKEAEASLAPSASPVCREESLGDSKAVSGVEVQDETSEPMLSTNEDKCNGTERGPETLSAV